MGWHLLGVCWSHSQLEDALAVSSGRVEIVSLSFYDMKMSSVIFKLSQRAADRRNIGCGDCRQVVFGFDFKCN